MQRDIFKPTLLSLVIAQSLLTACSPSPSNSRDTSPATPVIAQPTPVVAAPTMMMEAAAMSKMARYSPIMPMPTPRQQDNSEKYQHLAVNPIHQTATDAVATFSIDTATVQQLFRCLPKKGRWQGAWLVMRNKIPIPIKIFAIIKYL